MADNVTGVTLEIGGFTDYINSFLKIDEAHKSAANSADELINEFVKLQLNMTPIPVTLQGISSEISSGLGINTLNSSINTLETTFNNFGSILNTTLQQLLKFANAPVSLDKVAVPDISEKTNVFITDADRILAKITELNNLDTSKFIGELIAAGDALTASIDAGAFNATFTSLNKTLTGFRNIKGIDEIANNINKMVGSISQFANIGNVSTSTIDSLATTLPNFVAALKKFDAKSITAIPEIIAKIGDSFVSFQSVGNITEKFPQFVTDFTNLGAVFKDLSSGKGATRLAEILKELAPAVTGLISAFSNLDSNSLGSISNTFTTFGNALKDFGLGIKRVSEGGAIDVAISGIQKLVDLLDKNINVNAFNSAFTSLATTLKAFSDAIKTFVAGKSLDTLPQRITIIVESMKTLGSANLSGFASQLQQISPQLEKFSAALKLLSSQQNLNVLLNNVDALSTAIGRSSFSFQAFTFIVEKVGGAVASGLGMAISFLANFTVELGKFIGSSAISFFQNLISIISSVAQAFVSIPFTIVTTGFNLILQAVELILSPITAIISLFQSLGSILSSAFGGGKAATELQQTGTASQQLDSNIQKLDADLKTYNTTANQTDAETQQLGNSFSQSDEKLIKFVSTMEAVKGVSSFLFNAFQQVRFGLQSIVGEAFNAAVASEKLKTSLESLTARDLVRQGIFDDIGKSAGVAQQEAILLQNAIENLAVVSPFSKEDISEGLKLGLTFNFTAEKAFELTKSTTDFVTATGQSGEVIGEVVNILGKLNTTGKLTSAMANELAKRGIDIRGGLGEAFKLTGEEVQQTIKKGLVPANVAIKVVTDQMNVFRGAAQQSSNTLEGLISSAQDLKDKALRNLFTGVFEAFKPFGAAINEILLSPELFATVDNLGETIKNTLLGAVQSLAGPLGTVVGLFNAIPQPVFNVIKILLEVAAAIVGVVTAFAAYNAIVSLVTPLIGLFLNPLALTTAAIVGLSIVIYQNIDAITAFISQFEYLIPSSDSVNSALMMVGNGFLIFFNNLVQLGTIVQNVGSSLGSALLPSLSTLSTSILGVIPNLVTFANSFISNFGTVQQSVADNVSAIVDYLSQNLSNFTEFGSGLINAFADGIISAISIVESAIGELGSAIAYLMAPGSPPRFLPDIDKWGTDTANVYLSAFSKADFGVISDFGSTLGDLFKNFGDEFSKNVKIKDIINTFSDAFAQFKFTGNIDTSFFDQLATQAGAAGESVVMLAQQFFDVAKATSEADIAAKAYDEQVNKLQGTLDKLDASQTFTKEQQQLDNLNQQLKSRFTNEEARKRILDQITRITAQRELRGLENTKKVAEDNLKTAQDSLDVTKARLGLSNQFDSKGQTAAGGGSDAADAAEKVRKQKLKKAKGDALDIADIAEKANQSLVKLSAAKIDTTPLDNFKKSFQSAKDNISTAFGTIQERFNTFKTNLEKVGVTFDTVKKAAIGLGAVLASVFVIKNLTTVLPILIQFAEPIAIITSGLLAAGAAFLAFELITGKLDLGKIILQVNDLIDKFNSFGLGIILPKLDVKVFTDGLKQVQDAIANFSGNASKGNNKDLISNIFSFDSTSLSGIATSLGNIFNNITSIVQKFVTNLKSFSFGNFVDNAIKSLTNLSNLPKVFTTAFGSSSGILDGIKNGLISVGKNLLSNNPFTNLFSQLLSGINIGDTSIVTNAISKLFDFSKIKLPSFDLSGLFSGITQSLPDFGTIFSNILNSFPVKVFSEISRIFTEFFTQISSSDAAQKLSDFASAAGFAFTEVSKLVAGLTGIAAVLIGGAIEQAPQIFFSLIDALTATLNFIGSFIKSFEDFFKRGDFSLNSFVQLGIDLFHSFTDNISQFLSGVTGFFDGFNKIIDNAIVIVGNLFGFDGTAFLEKFRIPITIIETLITGKFLGAIFSLIKNFELFKAGAGLVNKTLSILIAPFKFLISIFQTAFTVVSRLFGVFGVLNRNLVALFTGTDKVKTFGIIFKDIFSIIKTGEPAFSGISKSVTVLGKIFENFGSLFKSVGANIGNFFEGLFGSSNVASSSTQIGKSAGVLAKSFLESFFTSIKTFFTSGFGATIVTAITGAIPVILAALPGVITAITSFLTQGIVLIGLALAGAIAGLAYLFVKFGPQVLSFLGSSLSSIGSAIVSFFTDPQLGTKLKDAFVSLLQGALNGLLSALSFVGSIGLAIFNGIVDGIDKALTSVGLQPQARSFVDSFLNFVTENFAKVSDFLQPVKNKFNDLKTFISGLTLPDPFGELVKLFTGEQGITTTLGNISQSFTDLVTQITGLTIPNPFAELMLVINGQEGLGTALTNVSTDFTNILTQITGIVFPNPFADLITFITGDGGIKTVLDTLYAAFIVVKDAFINTTIPNVFQDITDFLTGKTGLVETLTNIQTEFTNLKSFLDTFVLPAVFQSIVDAISGENGLIVLLGNLFDKFNTFQSQFTGLSFPNPFEIIYNVLAGPGNISEKIDTLLTAFENLSAGIAKLTVLTSLEGLKTVLDNISTVIGTVQTGFSTFGTFLDSFGIPNPFQELSDALGSLQTLLTNAKTGLTDIQTFLNGLDFANPMEAINQTLAATKDLVQPLEDAINGLVDFFAGITIPNPFANLTIPDTVKSALKLAGIDVGDETGKAIADSTEEKTTAELSNKDIKFTPSPTTLASATTAGTDIATSTVDGFQQGLDTAGKNNEETTKSWFQSWVTDPLKEAAGIQSPSTVADETIGQPIGQGILQGILTALTDGNSSLQTALTAILTSFESFKTSFVSSATDLGAQLVSTFNGISQTIAAIKFTTPTISSSSTTATTGDFSTQFTQKFTQINQAFTTFKTALSANFVQLFSTVNTTTDNGLKDLLDLIETFFQDVLDDFDEFAQDLMAAIETLNRRILEALETLLKTILKRIQDFFDDFISLIQDSFDEIQNIVQDAFDKIKGAFQKFFDDTITAIKNFLGNVKTAFNDFSTIMKNAADAGIKAFSDAITSGFANSVIPAITNAIKTTGAAVQGEFSNIGSKLADKFIDGLVSGFHINNGNSLYDAIKGYIDSVIEEIKKNYGIASPSKFMKEEIGIPLANGIVLGISETNPKTLSNAFIALIDSSIETVKNKYGIRSPSEVTRKLLGNNLIHGIIKGVDELLPNVNKSFDSVANIFSKDINVGNVKLGDTSSILEQIPNLTQSLTQSIDTNYTNVLSNLPDLTQKVNLVTNGIVGNLDKLATNLTLPEKNILYDSTVRNSSNLNTTKIDKSLDMSSHKVVSITNNRQYVMNMTVSPERAVQVRRNFKVAEFLG